MKKLTVLLITALILLLPLACLLKNDSGVDGKKNYSPPTMISTLESQESDSAQDIVDIPRNSNAERTFFTVDFLGDAAENLITVSLILPEGWTSDPSGIFNERGDWVASIELHKAEANDAFTDIDKLYTNVASTKEMTVSEYPAKQYVLKFEKSGNGEIEAGTQYLYYIMVDDAYVLVLFAAKGAVDANDEAVFDNIFSSFEVAAED